MMTVEQTAVSAERPFPGLRPFAYRDHEFFFGREEQSFALYRLVDRNRFVAVIGSSGSGKSSLVRAGLLPLLDAETEGSGGREWLWREMRPGDEPLSRLTYLIASFAEDADPIIASARQDRIAAHLRRSSFGVAEALGEIDGIDGPSIMLVIDQFEELFRYAAGKVAGAEDQTKARDEAVQFVQLLLEATRTRTHKVHVLLTMRSDYIGDCARFYGLPEAVSATQFLVPALTRDQLEEVIRKPIEKADATIASDLVERLLNDCSSELDQLPVLQHCLLRLWEESGRTKPEPAGGARAEPGASGSDTPAHPTRILTVSQYQAIGGFANALSQHANEILRELPGARLQLTVEQIFCALSELDKEGRAIRRALPFSQLLAETGGNDSDLRQALDRFRADDCSFLVPPKFEQPVIEATTRIDVGHEAFLRRWEKTSGRGTEIGWLTAEQRDGERYRALLAMAENETATLPPHLVDERWAWWSARRRTPAWAARYGGGFDRVQRLLLVSRRQQVLRRWTRVAAVAVVGVFAVVMFFFWRQAEFHKQRAEKSHAIVLNVVRESMERLHSYLEEGTINVAGARALLAVVQQTLNDLNATGQEQDRETKETGTQLLITMSDVSVALSDSKKALALAEQARANVTPQLALSPRDKSFLHLEFLSLFRMGDAKAKLGNRTGAAKDYDAALTIAKDLASREPGDAQRQHDLALIFKKIGDIHQSYRRWAAAIREYQGSLEIAQQQVAKDPDSITWRREVAASMVRIGQVLSALGDFPGALNEYREALRIQTVLVQAEPDNDTLWTNQAMTFRRIGDTLQKQGDFDKALMAYEQAVDIREKLHNKDAGNGQYRKALAADQTNVGDIRLLKGNPAGATNNYRTALQIREDLAFRDPGDIRLKREYARAHDKIGFALLKQGKLDDALDHYQQAVDLYQQMIAAGSTRQGDLFAGYIEVGDVQLQLGKKEDAFSAYRAALALAEKSVSDGTRGNAGTTEWQVNLSSAYEKIGDLFATDEARRADTLANYRKALAAAKSARSAEPNNMTALQLEEAIDAKLRSLEQSSESQEP